MAKATAKTKPTAQGEETPKPVAEKPFRLVTRLHDGTTKETLLEGYSYEQAVIEALAASGLPVVIEAGPEAAVVWPAASIKNILIARHG